MKILYPLEKLLMSSNKIAIFGCKSTTQFLIENLSEFIRIDYLITIDSKSASANQVADYTDLTEVCKKYGIEKYVAENYSLKNDKDFSHIKNLGIDVAFAVGWQRLVPANILKTLSVGAFGMHGSGMDLPLGRGRSPMNWAIIEGRKQFYTNLFMYDAGVDSGDVLDTFKFHISEQDCAESMHFKNTLSMVYLIRENIDSLLRKDFSLKKQDNSVAPTYYPKRKPENSLIDWNQDLHRIDRFIRAVAPPFNGAYSYINNSNRILITKAQVFDPSDYGYGSLPTGSVVQIFPNGKFLVKCLGGLLYVTQFNSKEALKKGDIMGTGPETLKVFNRNQQGFFDIEE